MTGRALSALRSRLFALVWLLLVWFALWGSFSPALLLVGVGVAALTLWVFPLPPVELVVGVHPLRLLALVGRFLGDVTVGSAQVAWLSVRPGHPRSAITEVQLTTRSDLVQTITAMMVSLVPGSIIVHADPEARTLTIHVLDTRTHDVDDVHRTVLDQERRILRAIEPRGGLKVPSQKEKR
ncbi:Na+/H+ antiporter subunit E [Nakamurella deserti]|uniref:Na+/H+ antiporter subunit E n=1 Tax=Nakamurella deserti TaxID=2164074 RepID=UPI000DBE9017|nr:Na+/H+ antiporter subunit E [Nakamurella deserti]